MRPLEKSWSVETADQIGMSAWAGRGSAQVGTGSA